MGAGLIRRESYSKLGVVQQPDRPTVRIASKNHQMYLNAALSLIFKAF